MTDVQITRLMMIQTGTYQDQLRRSLTTHLDGALLNQIQNVTRNGAKTTPSALATVASNFVHPSTEGHVVMIPNGFDTNRIRFMMEVASGDYQGGQIVQYVCGYTDHYGVSAGGHFDPHTRFYINSVVTTRRVVAQSTLGSQYQQRVSSADHLLVNSSVPTGFSAMATAPHRMAPEDVFNTMGLDVLNSIGQRYDARTMFMNGQPKKSRRSNTLAPQWMSKILTAHGKAMTKSRMGQDFSDSHADIMDEAADLVSEEDVTRDLFLSKLNQCSSFREQGHFVEYRELLRMAPNLAAVTKLLRPSQNDISYQAHNSNHWQGTTHETVIATTLTHSVPGLMMDLMLTKLRFTITNRTLDASIQYFIGDVKSFAGDTLNLHPYVEAFMARFIAEIWPGLTKMNSMDIDLNLSFDVLGATSVSVSVQGRPHETFIAPSFCDSLFTPIWGTNAESLQRLASDVSTLCTNLESNNHHGAHQELAQHYSVNYNPSTAHVPQVGPTTTAASVPQQDI